MADASGGAEIEQTPEDVLAELESEVTEASTQPGAAPPQASQPSSVGSAAGSWMPKLTSMFTITKEEQDAIQRGTQEIQQELGKVGQEFNKSIETIGGLLGGALRLGTDGQPSAAARQKAFESQFPDLAGEVVINVFDCNLVQKVRCYHNAVLPEKSFLFGGKMYVTDKNVAFYARTDLSSFGQSMFPVTISLGEVDKVAKLANTNAFRITSRKQVSFIFANFSSADEMVAAMELAEGTAGEAQQPQRESK